MGLKRLLNMGTILQIPQAGLATTDEKIKTRRTEVLEVLKASIEGLGYTAGEREDSTDIIGKWMALNPTQAARAYESVKDTYSKTAFPPRTKQSLYCDARRHRGCKR